MIRFETSHGNFTVELFQKEAPLSAANFQKYVDDGFFDGTIFHRIIPGFMIQGGGLTKDFASKTTREPIKNEAKNGLKNQRGTLSMARTSDINSATSQFFVNLVDNGFLDNSTRDYGYAVFGRVTEGMDTVDKIAAVKTGRRKGYQDAPIEDVVIVSARTVEGA
ncbi:MAG TPA: peptidylprolyl isomerase [Steroidobacteraceae bacterium]|nr:peptidylprolyl isomerase [Steroidobacteraceae bacterium]